ncbi:UPF0613 protein PB24D3.06c [Ceratocystis fimbriata CBS 114723]|uniref:UPF0613 protein PB24D3.06c n=1 Tax=Ceratocystis fimbriata CBS 114723 TaxID=1035309 RepID=A0A2C5WYC0_9PEZI|nr:UPF0613 protein PB24D3.06c [Ceratocystis fimbriata CBS 114723]
MAPFQVTVHPFDSPTPDSCAYESGSQDAENAIIVIGGLGGGPHTLGVARKISDTLLNAPELSYSLFEIRMRSSFNSYGHSSLQQDAADISALVDYLRLIGRKKIVLLGHSTGCQDIMMYNKLKDKVTSVDGFILQGPVSDRQAFMYVTVKPEEMETYKKAIIYARNKDAEGKGLEWMPRSMMPEVMRDTPFTVYHFLSLVDVGGDDDFFSSDLSLDAVSEIWTSLTKPAMVLHSGEDEFVPKFVNKEGLISKWKAIEPLVSPLSGVIPGADHAVSKPVSAEWYCNRIVDFLGSLEDQS